ncbi:MAG: hypothetical protein JWM44_534 [Bacilli bacterium]|nr:hypothetical protein [Bacilli bacterium]
MQTKRMVTLAIALTMMAGLVAGCGGKTETSGATTAPAKSATIPTATPVPKEPVVVKIFAAPSQVNNENVKKMYADFEKKENIKVQMEAVPGEGGDMFQKIDVAMMSGDDTDVIPFPNNIFESKYAMNGFLAPLNDLAKQANYDLTKVYGKYLVNYDTTTYTVPYFTSMWAVYYNKNLFDAAKIPYPKGDWTWDQYVDTAKKLTDASKGIYGSFMMPYDATLYLTANQKKVPAYKPDGTSNFDDPAFKESLKFFYDLGTTWKIQPSWLELKTKKMLPEAFMNGKFGMEFIGSFMLGNYANKTQFPRDFKFGITSTPAAGANGKNNLTTSSFNGINKNSKHPAEAFKLITFIGENYYKYVQNIPALDNLSKDQLTEVYKYLSDSVKGEVTTDELINAFSNNGLGTVSEKITGSVATEFKANLLREAELYYVDKKSLDAAVSDIKKTTDTAIADKKAQKK